MAMSGERAQALIGGWYWAGLAAVEPAAAVRRHVALEGDALVVDGRRIEIGGRLVLLAVGKAASAMARGALAVCGGRVDAGIVITKDGHGGEELPPRLALVEAGHPIPDERGERATRRALELAQGLGRGDVLLTLISGGGSALLEAPRAPATLDALAETTGLLLRAGAPIEDLNAVRRCLSDVKAGGLRRAAAPAEVVTLILSDVLGNDPRVIASGPTIDEEPASGAGALAVLDRYRLRQRVPPSVSTALAASGKGVAQPAAAGGGAAIQVIGDNGTALAAVAAAVRGDGLRPVLTWRDAVGEAAGLGEAWVEACREAPAAMDVLLGGGEMTVTVRGDGVGGRTTEFALAAALVLAEDGGWAVGSLATDGEDGPTGVAGAVADPGTAARAAAAGVDPAAALVRNDSLRVFEAAGGIVRPGPTGTNVNDLYFGVRLAGRDGVSST